MTTPIRERWSLPLTRFAIAVGLGGLATAELWQRFPAHLNITTDIIGNQIFSDFDVFRYIDGYYFIVGLFPLLAVAIYLVLSWKGPIRYRGPDRGAIFPLPSTRESRGNKDLAAGRSFPRMGGSGTEATQSPAPSDPAERGSAEDRGPLVGTVFWTAARILLPAFTVVLELSIIQNRNHRVDNAIDLAGGVVYVVAVALVALALRTFFTPRAHSARLIASEAWRVPLNRSNSLVAISVVPLLYFVSRSTVVTIGTQHRVVVYPWLPAWLVIAVSVICLLAWGRSSLRSGTPGQFDDLEGNVLTWVVGPVALFTVLASLPGALGSFQAFDDAQSLAAPQLIFRHGLVPWRDIYLIHGLLGDLFTGQIGMSVFGNTRWGSNAGTDMFVTPAIWISLYGFCAYFCRKNRLVLVGLSVAIVGSMLQGFGNIPRFITLPLLLVMFDVVLRRGSWGRCWLFAATMIVAVILTPEEALFVPILFGTLLLYELSTRSRGQGVLSSLSRFRRCILAAVVLTAAWALYLASAGSLSAFVDFFYVFAQGHDLEGAYATQWSLSHQPMYTFMWVMPSVLWLMTVWRVVAKLRRRSPWSITDWVMVAAAGISVVYFPKVLERADVGHVLESFAVATPLFLLWVIELVKLADTALGAAIRRLPQSVHLPRLRHPATGLVVIAVLLGSVTVPVTVASAVSNTPGNFHPHVKTDQVSTLPRLGYTTSGSVDVNEIRQLRAILNRYAGPTAPVFDYSNQPGIVYYLLNRVPGTRFFHSEVVQTHLAQQEEINDLKASRPPIVIFTNTTFGLLSYDGVPQSVRSFEVSRYLFDHYTPLLDVQGQLLMLRNDLHRTAPPVPSGLRTRNLYFDTPSCTLGDIPDFFKLPVGLASAPRAPTSVSRSSSPYITTIRGWAVDAATKSPVSQVIAVAGGQMVATAIPRDYRPDVAKVLRDKAATHSGFTMSLTLPTKEPIEVYAADSNGTVTFLNPLKSLPVAIVGASSTPSVPGQDGKPTSVVAGTSIGNVDEAHRTHVIVNAISLQPTEKPSTYHWIELQTPGTFAHASFTLSNSITASAGHTIRFNTLPRAGKTVYVSVGSCLQWQGYGMGRTLYLLRPAKRGAQPVTVHLVQ